MAGPVRQPGFSDTECFSPIFRNRPTQGQNYLPAAICCHHAEPPWAEASRSPPPWTERLSGSGASWKDSVVATARAGNQNPGEILGQRRYSPAFGGAMLNTSSETLFFFFFWSPCAACGVLVPRPPRLHWKRGVLTPGPPGKSRH